MIQTVKQNKKAVLAFLLALVMLIGIIPFTATEVQAVTIPVGDITTNDSFGTGAEWQDGDELYFCRVSKENQWAEYTMTANVENGVTTWTPSEKLYWDDKGEHKLVVNYPAGTGFAWDRWYVSADQSTLEKLKAADHMNAMWKGNPTTDPINLNLKHRLSMVTVTYTFASEFADEPDITPEVYSNTQYMLFDINTLERRNVEWQEDHAIWVTPYQHDGANGEKQFTAIVSPDAYSAGDEFIRITIGDQVLTAKMKEDITFEEGTHYTFDLKVGKDVAFTQDAIYIASEEAESEGAFHVYTAKGLQMVNSWMNDVSDSGDGILHIEDASAITALKDRNMQNIILKNDIQMPSVNDGESNWLYIGNWNNPYAGTFDGEGHTVSGIKINAENNYGKSYQQAGMFGVLEGVVKNVIFKDCSVTGAYNAGIVAGYNDGGTISNVTVTGGSVTGVMYTGGIVGSSDGWIVGCSVTGSSTVTDVDSEYDTTADVGGIVGSQHAGGVIGCTSDAIVSLTTAKDYQYIGGIVGNAGDSVVIASGFTGMLINPDGCNNLHKGGIVGSTSDAVYGSWTSGSYNLGESTVEDSFVGCYSFADTATINEANITAMNQAIDTYNQSATVKCDYTWKMNTDTWPDL